MQKRKINFFLLLSIFILGCCAPLPNNQNNGLAMSASDDKASAYPLSLKPEAGLENAVETLPMDEKIAALEIEILRLKNEMDLIRPALKALIETRKTQEAEQVAIKSDKQQAAQLNKKPVASIAQKNTKSEEEVSAVRTSTPKLMAVRVGEHTNKTRLVLDIGRKTSYSYDLDNNEKVLVIDLAEAPQEKALSKTLAASPYIMSYQTQSLDKGSRVIIQLKKPAKIIDAQTIDAEGPIPARIFFDITSAS